jgi:hypothetical protein
MRKFFVLVAAITLLAAGGSPRQDGPAAVLVKLNGPVQVQIGDGAPQTATVGTRLSIGDRVIPGINASAIVVFSSGATRTLSLPTTVEAEGGGEEGDMFSRTVQVLTQAASSDARSQPNRQGMIRPVPGAPEIIGPRNDIPVRTIRPTFSWHPAEGHTEYMVQIRQEGSPPVRYEVGATTTWTLPDDAPALTPGEDYWWTVGPRGRGRPSREMRFQVLSLEKHDALNQQLGILLEAGLDPDGDGAFMAAVIYREAGLYYDAAAALGFLEDAGQPLGVAALLLKGEIMDAMGDLEAAQEAFDEADRVGR